LFAVCKSQIIADGKTDNKTAIDKMMLTGVVTLPSGAIVYSGSLINGDTFLSYKQLFNSQNGMTFNKRFEKAKYTPPITIIGQPGTILICTNTDTTKAALYVTGQGRGTYNTVASIKNVTFVGKGIGLVAANLEGFKLDNVRFVGFKDGLILNNVYGFEFRSIRFDSCNRAGFFMQSHGGSVICTWMYQCKTGFEICSNNIVFNFLYANFCGTGLIVRAGRNEFHSASFEGDKFAEAQIIIGNDNGPAISGTIFSSLLIVSNANSKSGIWFKKTASNVYINGDYDVFIKSRIDSGSLYKLITK